MATLAPGAALLPLRLFLGGTFVYAGVQKLSDPGFLRKGAPTYIGTQLRGFAHQTPGGFLLRALAIPHPKLAGLGVALIEIAVGLLVLAGLLTRAAAAAGLGLNLVLFLTNSWHTSPYFLGSDIVFVFAWLPLVLAGAAGQPAVDHALGRWAVRGAPWSRATGALATRWEADLVRARGPASRAGEVVARPTGAAMTRRGVLAQALGFTALGTLAIGGLSALLKGAYRGAGHALPASAGATAPPVRSAARGHSRAAGHRLPAGAVRLGPASRLPAGQAATYPDPADGRTDIVIRDGSGGLRAFSAVCTHAGCTVGYQAGQLVCPCHGGTFDARTGAVLGGPPPQGLAPRKVVESGGDLYAVPD